ncbi:MULTISPECIES: hypothetical protein [Clostridium]|uniref:hypothetical protein n=1 Tax=Clostridium TaxID=1485 RepID=UPI001CA7F652|nr:MULTISPECIES: hypothetical protein [Clostridium]MBZ0310954.1 hypothetical protein [Clostridium butyricum]MCQ2013218.1 hypothetical protein [Clostridium butyricum]MDU2895845.1 hypothetical protein [Clostridium sp.]MDU3008237.1 hypothetical protein [Clostridium sp.]MDU3038751.1 hypothetical protein [Clostridium sp.]
MDTKKYEDYKKQLIEILIAFLKNLNSLEEEYNIMEENFNNSYEGNQIPVELIDKGRQIWKEFSQKKRGILREYCTEKVSETPRIGGSMGKPTQFYFIEKEHNLQFIMKTEKKAVIEIDYEEWKGSCFGKQFIFSPTKDGWKINSIKERLGKDESWSKTYM